MKKKPKRKRGRPTLAFRTTQALYICTELAKGRPLTKIVEDARMPGLTTVYKWLMENEKFAQAYARAREDQADTLADQTLAIADEDPALVFEYDKRSEESIVRIDSAAVQHQKLRVDSRKWFASKMLPKRYGDKVEQTHQGPDGKPLPAATTIVHIDLYAPPPETQP